MAISKAAKLSCLESAAKITEAYAGGTSSSPKGPLHNILEELYKKMCALREDAES